PDIYVGGAEAIAQYVRPRSERFLQGVQRVVVRSVAQRRGTLRLRSSQHTIDDSRLHASCAEEHPTKISATRRFFDTRSEPRSRKRVRQVGAYRSALGHYGASVDDRGQLTHWIDGEECRLFVLELLEAHQLDPVRRPDFLQHPMSDPRARQWVVVENDLF